MSEAEEVTGANGCGEEQSKVHMSKCKVEKKKEQRNIQAKRRSRNFSLRGEEDPECREA